MNILKDFLESKRNQYDLSRLMQVYAPKKMHFLKEVFDQERFRCYATEAIAENGTLKQLSQELNIPEAILLESVKNLYREIERARNLAVTPVSSYLILKTIKSTFAHLFVSETTILSLKQKIGDKPIILLPNHRSYLDFLLISFVLYDYDIELPSIISGIGLGNMLLVSYLLRSCGALFMRRSFRNDKVYSAAFKTYVQSLLKKADAPLEFFIEGTRSRSGKHLMPKFGCLKIIIDLFTSGQESDVLLLPISIQYDKVAEDELLAYEVLGRRKPKESSLKLIQGIYWLIIKNYGDAYINFGEPISLCEYLNQHEIIDVDELAYTIISSQKRNNIITSFNLLCTVLTYRLYAGNNGSHEFFLSEIMEHMKELKHLHTSFDAIVNFEDQEDSVVLMEIERLTKIHDNLITLNDRRDKIVVNLNNENASSDCSSSSDYRPDYVVLIMLQYYANTCVAFCINVLVMISLLQPLKLTDKAVLFESYSLFRRIFKHEFVFQPYFEKEEFHETLRILSTSDIIRENSSAGVYLCREDNFTAYSQTLLKPFVEGVLFIFDFLLQNLNGILNRKDLIEAIRKHAQVKLQQQQQSQYHEYWRVYILSSDFISNTLASLADMNTISLHGTDEGDTTYQLKDSNGLAEVINFLRTMRLKM